MRKHGRAKNGAHAHMERRISALMRSSASGAGLSASTAAYIAGPAEIAYFAPVGSGVPASPWKDAVMLPRAGFTLVDARP